MKTCSDNLTNYHYNYEITTSLIIKRCVLLNIKFYEMLILPHHQPDNDYYNFVQFLTTFSNKHLHNTD